jgi:hypothetical protein
MDVLWVHACVNFFTCHSCLVGCKVSNLIYILSFPFTDFICRHFFEKCSWSCNVRSLKQFASTGYVTSVTSIMNCNVWKWQLSLCSEKCQYNSLYLKPRPMTPTFIVLLSMIKITIGRNCFKCVILQSLKFSPLNTFCNDQLQNWHLYGQKWAFRTEVVLAALVNESNLKGLMLRLNHYIQEVLFLCPWTLKLWRKHHISLHAMGIESFVPLQLNIPSPVLKTWNVDLQLLSRPHTYWEYFSMHYRSCVWKY